MGITIPQVVTEDRASGAQIIDGSLKFKRNSSSVGSYLSRTPSSSGSGTTFTMSAWIKRSANISEWQRIFAASPGGADISALAFRGDGNIGGLRLQNQRSGWNSHWTSTGNFRDCNGWYHIVMSVDLNLGSGESQKIYINGVRDVGSYVTGAEPTSSQPYYFNNSGTEHRIGSSQSYPTPFDGYMSQFYWIDGQALGPESFGYTDPLTNTWRPKKYDPPALPATSVSWSTLPSGAAFQDSATQVNSGTFNNILTDDSNYVRIANNYLDIDMGETIPAGVKITFKFTQSGDDSSSADYALALSTASNYSSYTEFSETKESESTTDYKTITLITRKAFRYCRLFYAGGGRVARVYYLNITGATASERKTINYGTNGFYLPMDGNSPIGKDKSNKTYTSQINDGTTWSSSVSGPTSASPYNIERAFDGDLTTFGDHSGTNTTWTFARTFTSVTSLRVYINDQGGTSGTVTTVGGSGTQTDNITPGFGPEWHDIVLGTTGSTINSISFTRGGSGNPLSVYAIEVNGTVLVNGNSWTPVNFGGSVSLDKATGALPILNTVGGGNYATTGVRTDPYAANLVLALPLVGNANDVSNQINSGSTTKAISVNGSSATSASSNFYSGSWDLERGSSQYLSWSSTETAPDTGDFTYEVWFNTESNNNYMALFDARDSSADSKGFFWGIDSNGQYYIFYTGNTIITAGNVISTGRWYHGAVTRQSGILKMWLDGLLIGTYDTSNSNMSTDVTRLGSDVHGANYYFDGKFQDARIYIGVAKYTSNFIPGSISPDILPDTPSGVSGSSKLAKITDGAVSFPGATSDYLSTATSSDYAFGTGDFTVEGYVYQTAQSSYPSLMEIGNHINATGILFITSMADGNAKIYSGGFLGGAPLPMHRWNHVAFVRVSGVLKIYVNGLLGSSNGFSNNLTDVTTIKIGGATAGSGYMFGGQISNVRVIKGTAVYTGNFTPPTAPLTNVTNTKLLCCQSNTSAGAAAVVPGVSGINDGTPWSEFVTIPEGVTGVNYNDDASNWFDGDTSTSASLYSGNMVSPYSPTTVVFTPPSPITVSSGLRVYIGVDRGQNISVNGTQTNASVSAGWNDTGFTGTLTSLTLGPSNLGSSSNPAAFEVDGVILKDLVSPKGNTSATNFNPFNTDINTVRGQETGYPTWNPLSKSTSTLSNGNLTVTTSGASGFPIELVNTFTPAGRGQWYWEFTLSALSGSNYTLLGMIPSDSPYAQGNSNNFTSGNGDVKGFSVYVGHNGSVAAYSGAATPGSSTATIGVGGVVGWAYDAENGTLKCFINGDPQGTQFTNIRTDVGWLFGVTDYDNSATASYTINFGQNPFKFPPPAGYQPLNGANIIPETVIARSDQYMKTSLYTGSGPSTPVEVNLGFQPDLVWSKSRTQAYGNYLHDSVRGSNNFLNTNSSGAETVNTASDKLTFTSTGYTVNASSGALNESGQGADNMVSWSWKAGGNKGVFNVDDVGYANASDVNMSIGDLNSSAFNTGSYVSQITGVDYSWAGSATNGMFDGLNNKIRAAGSGSSFTWNTSIAASTLRVKVHNEGGASGNGGTFTVTDSNGTRAFSVPNSTNADVTNGVLQFTNVPVSGTLTQIVCNGGSGGYQSGIGMVEINGKILVDSGVTPPNVPSMANTAASVGTKQGFSIIKYNHNQNSAQTLAHGLTQTPQFIVEKRLKIGTTTNWDVYHASAPNAETGRLLLNTTATYSNEDGPWNDTAPTSSVFTIGPNGWKGDGDHIVYLWHSIPGFSKFSKWVGNNSNSGTFIELGFKPALIIFKCSDAGENWYIIDSSRHPFNKATPSANAVGAVNSLNADANHTETTSREGHTNTTVDLLSNGFKIRTTNPASGEISYGTRTYVYAAWAEAPAFNLYGAQSNAR